MVKDGIVLGKRYEVLSKVGSEAWLMSISGRQMLNRYVENQLLKKEFREDENLSRKFRSERRRPPDYCTQNGKCFMTWGKTGACTIQDYGTGGRDYPERIYRKRKGRLSQ